MNVFYFYSVLYINFKIKLVKNFKFSKLKINNGKTIKVKYCWVF